MVMEVVHEDMGEEDSSMQCMMNHPQKNTTPGGICALCLQEKLGKLVSSSFPPPLFPSSSSSPSPSFRSDAAAAAGGVGVGGANPIKIGENNTHCKKSKLPFVLKHKKDNNDDDDDATPDPPAGAIVFKRSNSIAATPRRRGMLTCSRSRSRNSFLDDENVSSRRRFWSFLYLSSKHYYSKKKSTTHTHNKDVAENGVAPVKSRESSKREESFVVVEENGEDVESPAAFERKVSRSKSVGCGSRSFSGDFFERISFSTGFGDCALRRVESQREGRKAKQQQRQRSNGQQQQQECGIIKERVRCGGIFSGLMIAASSSSSSSSCSSYRVSEDNNNGSVIGKSNSGTQLSHVRSRSWGWVLASPMRAFSKPARKRDVTSGAGKNVTPNLSAIPSLLSVSG